MLYTMFWFYIFILCYNLTGIAIALLYIEKFKKTPTPTIGSIALIAIVWPIFITFILISLIGTAYAYCKR